MSVHVEVYERQLDAVRDVLAGADEAILGVAFVRQGGVNLIHRELDAIDAPRLVTTTVFGSTTTEGLEGVQRHGGQVRLLNPSGGTFHPKLYIARHGDQVRAAVGSANLTAGLVSNVEVVTVLSGPAGGPQLEQLWNRAEEWWASPAALPWSPDVQPAVRETLDLELLSRLRAAVRPPSTIATLGPGGKPNHVVDITEDGAWVETERSRAAGEGARLVPAWMIEIAHEWLMANHWLTNRWLLASEGLNVKRSSFVCALLAQLPEVRVQQQGPIRLEMRAQSD